MKALIKVAFFSAVFFLFSFTSYAQRARGGSMSPEEMAKKQTADMVDQLKLNEDQEKQVSEINLTFANKMMDARKEASSDRSAMRSKMGTMMKEKSEELKKVLTEEQFKKLEELRSQNSQRRRGNGRGDNQGDDRDGWPGDRDRQ